MYTKAVVQTVTRHNDSARRTGVAGRKLNCRPTGSVGRTALRAGAVALASGHAANVHALGKRREGSPSETTSSGAPRFTR